MTDRAASVRRELAQQGAALPLHVLRDLDLPGGFRVEPAQLHPARQFRRVQRASLFDPQPREQLFRQDDSGGISNGDDLDLQGPYLRRRL